jgi:CheY-like chemotaxis protein
MAHVAIGGGVELKKTVLVVEDSPVIQRLIDVCLRPSGFETIQATDGISGFEAAEEHLPDLVILDVGLPGMDGWAVLDAIRSGEETSELVVLVLTAHAQEETRLIADSSGANAFLTKPFRPTELREMVAKLIGPAVRTA